MRVALLAVALLLAGCGGPDAPDDVGLPPGDELVSVQPGACEGDCLVSDPAYRAVLRVRTARETSDAVLGRALQASLAPGGWRPLVTDLSYDGDPADDPPGVFCRGRGAERECLTLFGALGEYALGWSVGDVP